MSEALTREVLVPHRGTEFQLPLATELLAFELTEVNSLGHGPGSGTGPGEVALRAEPFSLVFRGPRQPILPQAIYPLDHPVLGRLEIFLVPIGYDDRGLRYEAVFT